MHSWTLALLWTIASAAENPAVDAYIALKDKDYDKAVEGFRQAIAADPSRVDYRKELAYTLLKIGETEEARDQLERVVQLSPHDWHSALEYGYLCHETRRVREARRIFGVVRVNGDSASRAAALTAFQNVDRPLAAAIERWIEALAHNPNDFAAHQELAHAAEDRGDPKLAAAHYRRAFELNSNYPGLLVDLGRVLHQAGNIEEANGAWLAASRSNHPRAADGARGFLPNRYPYASEFQKALAFDKNNIDLRRELAFLWFAVNRPQDAEAEFLRLIEIAPTDLLALTQVGLLRLGRGDRSGAMPFLEKVLAGNDEALAAKARAALTPRSAPPPAAKPAPPLPKLQPKAAREMGDKSYSAGFLNDAARYYRSALEDDPKDYQAELKLGYTYNMLRQDDEAIRHFEIAMRGSTDEKLRRDARSAYRNVRTGLARIRTTVWIYPMFSSRWHSGFAYGQVKMELRLGRLPVRPYASIRFVGDSRSAAGAISPQYLSESSFIGALGLASSYKGVTAWAEAGSAVRYRDRPDIGRMTPDYRGGIAYGRSLGPGRSIAEQGWFFESHLDIVTLSRFRWDSILYSQNRGGYTLPPAGPLRWQMTWNANLVVDRNREAWANFFDTGPGVRFRFKGLPPSMMWSVDFLRGSYVVRPPAPGKSDYYDIRAGLWYAFTR